MLASNRVECCPERFQMQAATTKAYYDSIKGYFERAVIVYPKDPSQLAKGVYILERMAGLRGVRQQIGYLWAHTLKYWKHTYKADMPHTLTLGFMRAVEHDAHSLAELMALHKAG